MLMCIIYIYTVQDAPSVKGGIKLTVFVLLLYVICVFTFLLWLYLDFIGCHFNNVIPFL